MFLLLFIPLLSLSYAATLKDAFQAARLNMETLRRADSNVLVREEQKNRARAAVLPTIAGVGNYTRIDQPTTTGNSAFTLTKQYSTALRLTQPIIRGGVVGAYQLAQENITLANYQKDASDLNLYQLVINSYFGLKQAQLDLVNIEELLKASRERHQEIRERARIGRSRRGELVEAEANLHTAEATYSDAIFQKEEAERIYTFFTNLKPEAVPELTSLSPLTGSLEEYLQKLRTRPDILANQQNIQVADKQVSIAKGGHYPSVDFVGNYYFDRTGVLATSEWDAALVFSVPLFQGGGVQASVREAVAQRRVAELDSHELLRRAERDLAVLYRNYQQMIDRLESQKKAKNSAEEAYRLNRRDYQNGLVTNLDVLQSLNLYIQNKRSFDNLTVLTHQAFHSLEAATGVLP